MASRSDPNLVGTELSREIAPVGSDLEHAQRTLRAEIRAWRYEVVAELRGDILRQTRTMLFAMVGVVLTIAGLAPTT